jgi:hypothetical protein
VQSPNTQPAIADQEMTPLVKQLLARIDNILEALQRANGEIGQRRDEIAVLKGKKARPKFKPSKMDESTNKDDESGAGAASQEGEKSKRAGSAKQSKTAQLKIHEESVIAPAFVPPDARFKGYRDVVVQGLVIKAHNTRYRLETWLTREGDYLVAKLPASLQGHHFDPQLRSFILHQYHHCHVTQPLLLEQLRQWGVDVSEGQIDALLSADKALFHNEKDAILVVGLEVSRAVTVDDSGARHQGKNGYVLHIGNELFGWFGSTESKSQINFLEQLHAGSITTQVNEDALIYMQAQGLSAAIREQLGQMSVQLPKTSRTMKSWHQHLANLKITDARHIRIATEGALLGSLLDKGFNPELAIVSDGAGQFAIGLHALCWIHAERLIHKLITINDAQRQAVALVRGQLWEFYADLKAYKRQPSAQKVAPLQARFDALCTQSTDYYTLDDLLLRLHRRKSELLLVLKRPDIPLHTNGSETDIRDYVKKRKVSGGTRSDLGRQCRDTFVSLKKTCRKLGISFWLYLLDRVSLTNAIPPLPTIIRNAAIAGALP